MLHFCDNFSLTFTFQYMIILFTLFLIQFSIACSCLAVSSEQQQQFAEEGWNRVSNKIRQEVQNTFYCCGFNSTSTDHPSCDAVQVWKCTFQCKDCNLYIYSISTVSLLSNQFTNWLFLFSMFAKIGRCHWLCFQTMRRNWIVFQLHWGEKC